MHPLLTDGSVVSALSAWLAARFGEISSAKKREKAKKTANIRENPGAIRLQTVV
jgi:hypothetical protein